MPQPMGELTPDSLLQTFAIDQATLRRLARPLLSALYNPEVSGADTVGERTLLLIRTGSTLDWLFLAAYGPENFAYLTGREYFRMRSILEGLYDHLGTISGLSAFWRMGRPFADFASYVIGDGLKTQLLEWNARPVQPLTEEDWKQLFADARTVAVFLSAEEEELRETVCRQALIHEVNLQPVSMVDIPSGLGLLPFSGSRRPRIEFKEVILARDFPRIGTMNSRLRRILQLLND
ncbi:MAG: hypothetical protein HS115_14935 [Spirochaetales bacterium]|nr:hypothetical protein [Spirochaetales bacterium]